MARNIRSGSVTPNLDEPVNPGHQSVAEAGSSSAPALEVSGLSVRLVRSGATIPLVEDIDFTVARGEMHAVVGETGAGKTMTARALLGLLPRGILGDGDVSLCGEPGISLASAEQTHSVRGTRVGIVLQNPAGMFDPLLRIRRQLMEGVLRRNLMSKSDAWDRAVELLRSMGFADAEAVMELYPHQLSGGMAQRAAIAMTLMPDPDVIIADEPTSALDAHLRADVLDLLRQVAATRGAAVLVISHDLSLVSNFCDSISVLYAGRIVERGPTAAVLSKPQHPYTRILLDCSPALDAPHRQPLRTIAGVPPPPTEWPAGCVFEPRCPLAFERCRIERPILRAQLERRAACHLAFGDECDSDI